MIYFSVFLALVSTVGIFIILPTGVVNLMKLFTDSVFWLNFAEGAISDRALRSVCLADFLYGRDQTGLSVPRCGAQNDPLL